VIQFDSHDAVITTYATSRQAMYV